MVRAYGHSAENTFLFSTCHFSVNYRKHPEHRMFAQGYDECFQICESIGSHVLSQYSFTSVVRKLLESILRDKIYINFDGQRMIRDRQHGFAPGRLWLTNLSFLRILMKA